MTNGTNVRTLEDLNAADVDAFCGMLAGVFENAPWVATRTAHARPFATVEALHDALMATVRAAPADARIAFLCGHPELSPQAVTDPAMSAESRSEQAGLGLRALGADLDRCDAAIRAYREKFGFPFILCVRRHTAPSVLRTLEMRLGNDVAGEQMTALQEVAHITRLRLAERISGPGAPRVAGHLSTHVLDSAHGRPAAGVRVELLREGVPIVDDRTNEDGRVGAALIAGEPLRIGHYELRFHVGAYFAAASAIFADPPLFDVIPIRFAVAEPEGRYHIPLLVGPWTYTTYRGS